MKRISLWLVLLAFTPGIAQAYWYGSYYSGVHYSPYALSYRSSGLVPGNVDYSPYALSYGNSGLIDRGTQYTPYAVEYGHSGLVAGYGIYPGYSWNYGLPIFAVPARRATHAVPRAPVAGRRCAQDTSPPVRPQDGIDVIRRHLQGKGFASLSMERILRVDNQLVSVDFYVKDRDLLIKFWNPQEVDRLSTKEAFKQKAYAKYKQDWESYAERYKQTGGEIYCVNASEPQAIVAALESCTKLGPGNGTSSQPVLYAKN
jgi:hypothetical protein